ncbi:hypothetical protein LCGC14_3143970, partial [marine sediment metagenome]
VNVVFVAGVGTVASNEGAGVVKIVQDRVHFFDAYGKEQYLQGTPV